MNQIERSVAVLSVTPVTKSSISNSIKSMETSLVLAGSKIEILLRGWATFEAMARFLMPADFSKPQSPGRLVEKLAFEGYITPSEADFLRQLASVRNRFVHGDLDQTVSATEIETFIRILTMLSTFEPDVQSRDVATA